MTETVLHAGAVLATVLMAAFALYGAWTLGRAVAALLWEITAFCVARVRRLRKAGAR